jgi:hypothetical protein
MSEGVSTPYILLYTKCFDLQLGYHALTRLVSVAEDTGASMVYADHRQQLPSGEIVPRPLIDYQLGSVRDDFDFGSVLLLCTEDVQAYFAQERLREYQFAGLYDLRLFLTISPEEQFHRILLRNGPEKAEVFRSRWIPMEEAYFTRYQIKARCDHTLTCP